MNQEENIKTKNITEKITYDSKLVILRQRHGKYQNKNITEKITYNSRSNPKSKETENIKSKQKKTRWICQMLMLLVTIKSKYGKISKSYILTHPNPMGMWCQ